MKTDHFPESRKKVPAVAGPLDQPVRPWNETHPIWLALMVWEEAHGADSMRDAFHALGAAVAEHEAAAVAAERERCAKIVGKYGPSDFNDLGQILVEIHGA